MQHWEIEGSRLKKGQFVRYLPLTSLCLEELWIDPPPLSPHKNEALDATMKKSEKYWNAQEAGEKENEHVKRT